MDTANCPIYEQAVRNPQHPALFAKARTWSYGELNEQINALCNFLNHAGIQQDQRVAFIAHTSVASIALFFALFRLRAVACPLSYRLPQGLLADYIEKLHVSHVLEPSLLPPDRIKSRAEFPTVHLDDLATFLFTSGSSGSPKVACHCFANHYYNALGALSELNLEQTSRWLLSLPLFHVSGIGILFRSFLKGATVVLSDQLLAEAVIQDNITHISCVPTQLFRLLQEPAATLEKLKQTLKCILLGGAPISDSLIQNATQQGLPIYTTYGMTEMSSMVTLSKLGATNLGKLLPYSALKFENNEIWVGGKTLFQGYWDAENAIVQKADTEGWFPTRDLGAFTDGSLNVIGRLDRQFISGGENIQPEEIEQALCMIPGIRQASVVSIPDAEFGERPVAFVDDETRAHTLESIRNALKDRLPAFKHPVRILAYPSDAGLKPNFALLKQHLAQKFPLKTQE
jgi:O-succinylbenzoic acid--CoA ligase